MLFQVKKDNSYKTITEKLDSYWLLLRYSVAQGSGLLSVGSGYFATYHSIESDEPKLPLVLDNVVRDYRVTVDRASAHHFDVNNLSLQVSDRHVYMREVKELSLFSFSLAGVQPATWFVDGNFVPPGNFRPPNMGADAQTFLKQTLEMNGGGHGHLQNRYVHHFGWSSSNQGVQRLVATLPFLKSSFFRIFTSMGMVDAPTQKVPALKLVQQKYQRNNNTNSMDAGNPQAWSCFGDKPEYFPTPVSGYIMVCHGAFKNLALERSGLHSWHTLPQVGDISTQLLDKLSEVVYEATPAARNLENIDDVSVQSVYPGSPDGPVEMLYIDGLNAPPMPMPF